MNGRFTRIGLSLLLVALTALEIAADMDAGQIAMTVISLFVLIGLTLFIVPRNNNS